MKNEQQIVEAKEKIQKILSADTDTSVRKHEKLLEVNEIVAKKNMY
ncbi:MAG: hypothetical protein LBH22_01055 [Bacteroidales bacterium]|jgi:hypothetical protein|nr:hypothetical protein [Bacteroidales bacterium]